LDHEVIEAAKLGGATGGTIIRARGSGTRDNPILFNIEIDPEKEIILILSPNKNTDSIVRAIEKELNINQPGKGIIFVMDVKKTLGLYQGN